MRCVANGIHLFELKTNSRVASSWMAQLLGLGMSFLLSNASIGSDQNHLIPVNDSLSYKTGKLKTYRELWEKKLFVSASDLARFAHVAGGVGEEYAISVHSRSKDGNPDEYWLTVTKSPVSLWDCVAATDKSKRINPQKIEIVRCDIPLSRSTAIAIHNAWLAMLLRTRPDPNHYVVLDSTTEIFYVNHGRKLLRGQLPLDAEGNAWKLYEIAVGLAICCELSPQELPTHLRKVESMAAKLFRRVSHER